MNGPLLFRIWNQELQKMNQTWFWWKTLSQFASFTKYTWPKTSNKKFKCPFQEVWSEKRLELMLRWFLSNDSKWCRRILMEKSMFLKAMKMMSQKTPTVTTVILIDPRRVALMKLFLKENSSEFLFLMIVCPKLWQRYAILIKTGTVISLPLRWTTF